MADVVPQAVVAPVPRVLTDNAADAVRGIALAVLAYLIWTLGDVSAKWVLPSVGVVRTRLVAADHDAVARDAGIVEEVVRDSRAWFEHVRGAGDR